MLKVLVFCVVVKVVIEVRFIDSVCVDMSMGSKEGFLEEAVIWLSVSSMD